MTSAAIRDIEVLTPTWRELESQTHVKLRAIESERHYRAMISFMNDLLDMVGDRETHPLMGLLDVVTAFVHDYEERNVEIPDATPVVVLGFLMEQNNLRQSARIESGRGSSQQNSPVRLRTERDVRDIKPVRYARKVTVGRGLYLYVDVAHIAKCGSISASRA
jgi:antitoxin component HigA of HigAB toxin-antitoxin module